MEVLPVLEAIGFDYALIGVLTTTWVTVCVLLMFRLDTMPWSAVSRGGGAFLRRVSSSKTKLVLWGLLTAVSGMIGNALADSAFDSDTLFPTRKGVAIYNDATCSELVAQVWRNEDAIKQDVVRDVCHRTAADSQARAWLKAQSGFDGSRQLTQLALAELLASGSASANTSMRLEYVVVKVFRALALGALLLAVAVLVRILLQGIALRRSVDSHNLALAFAAHGLACLAMAATGFLLFVVLVWLWDWQSERYYKKLVYSALETRKLDATGISSVASYSALDQVPGFIVQHAFNNRVDVDGKTDMYEFSGIAQVGERTFVIDNETGRLNGEGADNALFEARFPIHDGQRSIELTRPPRTEFLGVEHWDDLEGLAADGASWLYAIGSHSLSSEGVLRPERHVLLRWLLGTQAGPQGAGVAYVGLLSSLLAMKDGLSIGFERSVAASSLDSVPMQTIHKLNIEGLVVVPDASVPNAVPGDLLLALRAPLLPAATGEEGRALVLRVSNVDGLFANRATAATVTRYAALDLHGRGIADLQFDAPSGGFLIAAAPANENDASDYSSLWLWKPDVEGAAARRELIRFEGHKLEGIARIDPDTVVLGFDEERRERVGDRVVKKQYGELVLLKRPRFQ